MTVQRDLLAEFDRDLLRGAGLVADDYVDRVRADGSTPRDTGKLAAGIQADQPVASTGRVTVDVRSTYRTPAGADVGTILDTSTGRVVEASSRGKRAFGPFQRPVPTRSGSTRFLPRFRVTTEHVGWWAAANSEQHLRRSADQLARVNL